MQHRRSFLAMGLLSAAVLLLAGWLGRSMMPTAGSRNRQAAESDALPGDARPKARPPRVADRSRRLMSISAASGNWT